MIHRISLFAVLATVFGVPLFAATSAEDLLKKPDAWFQSDEGREAIACIFSWQSEHGDWPKNQDTTKTRYTGDRSKLHGTFDNGATVGELRVLAKAFRATGNTDYEKAFLAGFDHIVKAQYSNGGWPQYFPLSKQYHRHITFNDGTMIRLLEFLRDVTSLDEYAFVDSARREAASKAIQSGIDCIVKCQVVVNGKATAWCAQHDEITLAPANARAYELASLSGAESAGILKFLISLDDPTPEVIQSVNSGAAWFEFVKIKGFQYKRSKSEPCLAPNPSARPLWARFYEIETFRPMFCDRDGIVKYDVEEIGPERRSGYTWYGNWGESLANAYAKWPHH